MFVPGHHYADSINQHTSSWRQNSVFRFIIMKIQIYGHNLYIQMTESQLYTNITRIPWCYSPQQSSSLLRKCLQMRWALDYGPEPPSPLHWDTERYHSHTQVKSAEWWRQLWKSSCITSLCINTKTHAHRTRQVQLSLPYATVCSRQHMVTALSQGEGPK